MVGHPTHDLLVAFARDESGVTAIEYALIAMLVSTFIIVGVSAVGSNLQKNFYDILPTALAGASSP